MAKRKIKERTSRSTKTKALVKASKAKKNSAIKKSLSKPKTKSIGKRKRKVGPKSEFYLELVKALKDVIRIKQIPNYREIYSFDKFLDELD